MVRKSFLILTRLIPTARVLRSGMRAASKPRQYFSTSDPKYLQMIQGGDQYLLAEAVVVRRGTTFNIAGPASGTLAITWTGTMTLLTPVKDPARGGWNISVPAGGTVGTYTATITDGAWTKSHADLCHLRATH